MRGNSIVQTDFLFNLFFNNYDYAQFTELFGGLCNRLLLVGNRIRYAFNLILFPGCKSWAQGSVVIFWCVLVTLVLCHQLVADSMYVYVNIYIRCCISLTLFIGDQDSNNIVTQGFSFMYIVTQGFSFPAGGKLVEIISKRATWWGLGCAALHSWFVAEVNKISVLKCQLCWLCFGVSVVVKSSWWMSVISS